MSTRDTITLPHGIPMGETATRWSTESWKLMTIVLIVGSAFVLVGLHLLRWSRRQRRVAASAVGWPVVPGHVVESHVSYAVPKTDDSDLLMFLYRFEVDGVPHASRQIDLFSPEHAVGLERAERVVKSYPQGSQVQVYFDPSDPSVSVIEPESSAPYRAYRNLGIVMACVGALILSQLTNYR